MELLLAALMMLWGSITADQPDMTMEQFIQLSLDTRDAIILEASGPPQDEHSDDETNWVKRDPQLGEAPVIRGIFSTGHTAGAARIDTLIDLINSTDLNAIVIDVKDDRGAITYKTENPLLQEIGNPQNYIRDISALMARLEENDIYPIARVVVFKDTYLANKRPDLSFLNADGSVWHNKPIDKGGEAFVNPYMREVWEYNIEAAKEAAALGFKEIQFDYVRFPEGFETRADRLTYEKTELSRVEIVNEFVKYAREQLNPLGVRVSVDIFGFAASVKSADGIGQDFNGISKYVDVISPMVYPSHYGTGWFGSEVPDLEPYVTINGAMIDTKNKLEELGDLQPIIRPWIQDFTADHLKVYQRYGKEQVEAQIQALYDNGIHEFLLWNSRNEYTQNVDYLLGTREVEQ